MGGKIIEGFVGFQKFMDYVGSPEINPRQLLPFYFSAIVRLSVHFW